MAFAGPAFAQNGGFFIGGSIGQTDVDEDITSGVIDSGDVDGEDTGWRSSAATCSTGISASSLRTSISAK